MPDQQPRPRPGEPEPDLVLPQPPCPPLAGGAAATVPAGEGAVITYFPRHRPGERRARSGSSVACEATYRMHRSSPTHTISSADVRSVCVRWPVAGSVLRATDVRVLRWKTAGVGFMTANLRVLEISDEWTVLFLPRKSIATRP